MRNDQIDAWMFLAAAYALSDRAHASLVDLIAAADWINHAVPLDEELRRGLNRLIAADVVHQYADGFVLTPAGESLLARVQKGAGIWDEWELLEREFATLEDPESPKWTPATSEIEAAVRSYQVLTGAALESFMRRKRKARSKPDRA